MGVLTHLGCNYTDKFIWGNSKANQGMAVKFNHVPAVQNMNNSLVQCLLKVFTPLDFFHIVLQPEFKID